MKKIIYSVIMLLLISGCSVKPLSQNEQLKVVVASDTHYFAKELYQDCEWFEESMLYGDGKMVTYADQILDEFIVQIKDINPDLVLITGDLSFNGEKLSHEGLAKKLKVLVDDGINVAVMPGNHDIDNYLAKGYGKDDYIQTEKTDHIAFKEIYEELGYGISLHEHKDSLSYSIQLNDKYRFILMDSNAHIQTGKAFDSGGYLTDESYAWLKKELEDVKENDGIPIVSFHHNLAIHNEVLNEGYTISNYEDIAKTLSQYNVPFVLSGHIHCQNIRQIEGIYDIASSSLLDSPLQFGVLELDNQGMKYHTQSLDIGEDDEAYFDTCSRNKMKDNFNDIKDKDLREKFIDFSVKANRYYFAGNLYDHKEELKKIVDVSQLSDKGFYTKYLKEKLSEDKNYQNLEINY